jgi:hypothetical protein
VISHRVHVHFTGLGARELPCHVTFTLEYEDGTPVTVQRNGIDTIVRQEGTLQGLLLEVRRRSPLGIAEVLENPRQGTNGVMCSSSLSGNPASLGCVRADPLHTR